MKFINYTVVKLSIFLTLGIIVAHYFLFSPSVIFFIAIGSFALLLVSWITSKRQFQPSVFFGISAFCCFFCMGAINYSLRLPEFQPNHYSKTIVVNAPQTLQLKIKEVLKPDLFNQKYIAEVAVLDGKKTSGRVLLNVQKDSSNVRITIDDILLVFSEVVEVPKPLNPNQFNYSNYLKTLGIHHQLRVASGEIITSLSGTRTLRGLAEAFRSQLIEKLQKTTLKTDERAIVQALVLGYRNDIDKEVYEAYAAAGAIHILAVSGLHVGILYVLLSGLLGPLDRLRRGALFKSLFILCLLWCFALVAGLSPSVVRAVTMFSFFSIAKASRRPTNSINTLFLSYFTLLLITPNWLFHVGFQLSYLAVFFILWIQPKLYQMYFPKNYLLKKIWSIFTVTMAAQLGIVPLSLYYFHQFPGLFLVTNLVVLPLLGLLLMGAIVVVVLAAFNILPEAITTSFNFLVELLNRFIGWIAQQEAFLFEDISFSEARVITSYLVITSLLLMWKKFSPRRLIYNLLCFGLFFGVLLFEKKHYSQQQLVVFQKNRQTLLGYKNGESLFLFGSDTTSNHKNTYPIKSYLVAQHITQISETTIPLYLRFKNKKILILDSLGVYPTSEPIDIVVFTESPKLHLDRLLDSLQPDLIVADGSNYPSYVSRWRTTCEKRKLPFHHTGSKGAFVLE